MHQENNISIDPIRLSSLHDFRFYHNHVYPTMVVKNIQIHGVVISGIWIYKSKNKLQITHSPRLRGRTMKTYFKMYCFKSIFLKHVTEECTFCGNVLLVTLSKNLVA